MKEEKINLLFHPVDYFNFHYPFLKIFDGEKAAFEKSNTEVCYPNPEDLQDDMNKPTYIYSEANGKVSVMKENPHTIIKGEIISKFHLFAHVKFKGDIRAAESHVMYKLMKLDVPYCRVGVKYYKIIQEENRWGAVSKQPEIWSKEEMKEDHTKSVLKIIPKYDKFKIYPSNTHYEQVRNNFYNLYSPFPHSPNESDVSISDIPTTVHLIKHIFMEHFELGMKYFKILYEDPEQMLPILVLVSEECETGKTTFLNYLQMLFGNNAALVSPEDLTDDFNESFATKNIILVDETVIDKKHAIGKLKSIATAKSISLSQKFVSKTSIPFFGKLVLCSNSVTDFAKIESAEIRFWVREVKQITGQRNVKIEDDLFSEIPKFIKYLSQLPPVDKSNSRMVFTADQIGTIALKNVKMDSRTWLHKEMDIQLHRWFSENDSIQEFKANIGEIKDKILQNDKDVKLNYLKKVLCQEMKIPFCENERYHPFGDHMVSKTGATFKFDRKNYISQNDFDKENDI